MENPVQTVPASDPMREKIRAGVGDAALDKQLLLALKVVDGQPIKGAPAIALGRATGIAMEKEQPEMAQFFWNRLVQMAPSAANASANLGQMYLTYQQSPEQFAAFAPGLNGFTSGSPFSNAVGSYAYALDYEARGDEALAGGNGKDAQMWGQRARQLARPTEQITQALEGTQSRDASHRGMIRAVSALMAATISAFIMYWVGRWGDSRSQGSTAKLGQRWLPWAGGAFGFLVSINATRPGDEKKMDDPYVRQRREESSRAIAPRMPVQIDAATAKHEGKLEGASKSLPSVGVL